MSILEVKNVEKILNKKRILDDVSFTVEAWEIYGFLWPNWAGKTTTMKCIMWLIKPEKWSINIFWNKWLSESSKQKIGFMPENTYLYKHLTWEEFLKFNWTFFGLKWEQLDLIVNKLLARVWLKNDWKVFLKDYSKWMLQRVWLAQAIINKPKLVFLDEPMSWLDPIWRKMVKDLIVELKKMWTTVFFNTHILADVENICDRVSIINKGIIIVEGQKVKSIDGTLENFFIKSVENSEKK